MRPATAVTDVGQPSRILTTFERVIFGGLLALIPLTAIPYGTVEPWWEAAFECIVFIFVALWIIDGMIRGEWGIKRMTVMVPILALVAYAFLQSIPFRTGDWPSISADPFGTRLAAIKLLAVVLAGALLLHYTNSRRRLRALIYVVLVTAVVSALFGLVRETTHQNAPGFLLPQLKPQAGYGQFINRNHFAYLMEMAFGLALGLAISRGETKDRLIYVAAALPVWTGLVLASSRGGVLSMLSQLLFLLVMYGTLRSSQNGSESYSGFTATFQRITGKLPVRIVLIAGLLAALVLGVFWIGGDPLAKRMESIQSEVASDDAALGEGAHRRQIWQATWKMFKDHPVAGVGFGGYWVAITEYYNVPGKKRPYEAHNDYLELLVSGGVIAIAILAWFLFMLIKRIRGTLRSRDAFRRAACLGAVAGLFGIAVHSIVDFGLHITINALVCMALIVIATVDDGREEKGAGDEGSNLERTKRRSRHVSTDSPKAAAG